VGLALAAQLASGLIALGAVELAGEALGPREGVLMGLAAVLQGLLLVLVGVTHGAEFRTGRLGGLALLVIAAGLVADAVLQLAEWLGLSPEGLDGLAEAVRSDGVVGASLFVGLVILAPLGEELVFRGALWRALSSLGTRSALVGTSIAFAVVHLDPLHVVATLPLAFFLGWLRHVTGSLAVCVVAHALNNAVWWLSVHAGFQGPAAWIAAPVGALVLAAAVWRWR